MPFYSYLCKCGHSYEEMKMISDPFPEKCPECGRKYGHGFEQDYQKFNITGTVYGDPKTVGQQAELNEKRAGKEQVEKIFEEATKTHEFKGKLPKNAKLVNRDKNEIPWYRSGKIPGTKKREKPLDTKKLDTSEKVQKYINTGETE